MAEPERGIDVELAHPTREIDTAPIEALAARVLDGEGVAAGQITIVLADHETVLELNRQYLRHDYLTDVLSFYLGEEHEGAPVEGEVYVDLDTAAERHAEFGSTFEAEVLRYVAHGLLHLIGHDDATPEDKAAMHALEDRYLASTTS